MLATLRLALALVAVLAGAALGLERFPVVSTTELIEMLEQREAGDNSFLLINTLDQIIADDASIPGSLHIPVHTTSTTDLLPENLDEHLVFY